MLKWKNILVGFFIALMIVVISYGISQLFYTTNQTFYWGNAQMLLTVMALILAWSTTQLVDSHIRKKTKDRFSRIGWDHPLKSSYFTWVMVLYWASIWGSVLNYVLYYIFNMGFYIFETIIIFI